MCGYPRMIDETALSFAKRMCSRRISSAFFSCEDQIRLSSKHPCTHQHTKTSTSRFVSSCRLSINLRQAKKMASTGLCRSANDDPCLENGTNNLCSARMRTFQWTTLNQARHISTPLQESWINGQSLVWEVSPPILQPQIVDTIWWLPILSLKLFSCRNKVNRPHGVKLNPGSGCGHWHGCFWKVACPLHHGLPNLRDCSRSIHMFQG